MLNSSHPFSVLGATSSAKKEDLLVFKDFLFQILEGIDGVHDFENSPVSQLLLGLQSEGFSSTHLWC